MPLPESIPVRYSEEEAGYVSFRPVVRQTFRLNELLDMVVSVTGKDPARVRQILHSGTVVFHFFRYRWDGFEVDDAELRSLLSSFPDPDPSRPFSTAACTMVLVESGDAATRTPLELSRAAISHKSLFSRRSFWDALLAGASAGPLDYHGYSYVHRADLYRLALTAASRAQLAAAVSLAPRGLREQLHLLDRAAGIVFVCPRPGACPGA